MPSEERTEHDFASNKRLAHDVSIKEFVLTIINERDHKYEQRFIGIDRSVVDNMRIIQETLNASLTSLKDSTLKAEAQMEKRFESVNEFRAQLGDQQRNLVSKSEVNIRFEALEKKLDAAVAQLQINKGRDSAIAIVAGALSILISALAVVAAFVVKH